MTCVPEKSSGRSTRSRIRVSLATRPGKTDRGSTPAIPLPGPRSAATKNSATSTSRWRCRPATSTVAIASATICSPTVWFASMRRPARVVWHFQTVHHDVWDYDLPSPPILANVTVDGRDRKIVAQPTKQGFLFVFDRVTGEPIWPIEERAVEQTDVPGERTSPTQPFPTKPAAYDRQGSTNDDLIDLTSGVARGGDQDCVSVQTGTTLHLRRSVRDSGGKISTLVVPHMQGGSNWPGGALDAETGVVYVASTTRLSPIGLTKPDASRSDMDYIMGFGGARRGGRPRRGRGRPAGGATFVNRNIGPQGLAVAQDALGSHYGDRSQDR